MFRGQKLPKRHLHCPRNRVRRFEIKQCKSVRDDIRSTKLWSRADLKFALAMSLFLTANALAVVDCLRAFVPRIST
jgi:hypothetical protein